jgi:hypothetical protein
MKQQREQKVVLLQKKWRKAKERMAGKMVAKFLRGFQVYRLWAGLRSRITEKYFDSMRQKLLKSSVKIIGILQQLIFIER